MRSITLKNTELTLFQILTWASTQKYCVALANNRLEFPLGGFINCIATSSKKPISDLDKVQKGKEYIGFINYDYKNVVEDLQSKHTSLVKFPYAAFFEPEVKIVFEKDSINISGENPQNIIDNIRSFNNELPIKNILTDFKEHTTKEAYKNNVAAIIKQIVSGNIYEINYCIAFQYNAVAFNPISTYLKLIESSATPFSCFVKYENQFLLCASPERYIKTDNSKIISQPIKGTKRVIDFQNTEKERLELQLSAKEQNENVMIVDLVRNDLSKVCEAGSVKVEELFGVYQFGNLYQMISTVSGDIMPKTSFKELIHATFPMGSMSGAPKFKALQLIDTFENFQRNIYSGTVGYINSNGDVNFNVVIRSIFYDADSQIVSYAVGSGITAMSDPEQEYEECLLKAKNIRNILGVL